VTVDAPTTRASNNQLELLGYIWLPIYGEVAAVGVMVVRECIGMIFEKG